MITIDATTEKLLAQAASEVEIVLAFTEDRLPTAAAIVDVVLQDHSNRTQRSGNQRSQSQELRGLGSLV